MFTGIVVGNVGKDAELKYLADGKPVVNFTVATTRKSKSGDETTWVKIDWFGTRAEKVSGYITKGKQVAVTGEVRNRPYEKDGQQRYSLEIIAADLQLLGGGKDAPEAFKGVQSSTHPEVGVAYVSKDTDPF